MLLLRTDPAAGGGEYADLSAIYSSVGGALIIVIDNPATSPPLPRSGPPAATTYLGHNWSPKLSNQMH